MSDVQQQQQKVNAKRLAFVASGGVVGWVLGDALFQQPMPGALFGVVTMWIMTIGNNGVCKSCGG
jgi:hypothetical protein